MGAALGGDLYVHHPTSVGFPPPAVDLKIVDPETLISCKDGDVGELWIKGPGVAKGTGSKPKRDLKRDKTIELHQILKSPNNLPPNPLRLLEQAKSDERSFLTRWMVPLW